MTYLFVGVDPGLVHTGVVGFTMNPNEHRWHIDDAVVPTPTIAGKPHISTDDILRACTVVAGEDVPFENVFIEEYRPRTHLKTDKEMVEAQARLRVALPGAQFISNSGIRQLVTKDFMELLGCWNFHQPTHHQDLRSAARIGLLGAMKSDTLSRVLARFLKDNASTNPSYRWTRI